MEHGWDRTTLYAALLLAAAVFATFGGSLGNAFVYDDRTIIQQNPALDTLDPREHLSLAYWSQFESDYEYYRPVTSYSLALDRALLGSGPRGFHFTNLLLHLLSSLLLFQILRGLGGLQVAGVGAGLFALHPVQTEAVVWASGRTDLLATLLVLLALLLHARAPERPTVGTLPRFVAPLLAMGAALLAKESAITLPAVLIGYEVAVCLSRKETGRAILGHLGRRFRILGPLYLLLMLGYLLLRLQIVGQLAGGLEAGEELWKNPLLTAPLASRWLTAVNIGARYLGLVVFPRDLSVDYFHDVVPLIDSPASGAFVASLLVVTVFAALSLFLARRHPSACFGLLAGAGAYALVSHVVFAAPIVMAERALYQPMVGVCSIMAVGIVAGVTRWAGARRERIAVFAVAAVLLVACGAGSSMRTRDWRNERTLFLATTEDAPASALGWNNLGAVQIAEGDVEGAMRSFGRAAEIAPRYLRARLNEARTLRRGADLDGAESRLRGMVADFPDDGEAIWLELAQLLARKADRLVQAGSEEEARSLREEAAQRAESFGTDATDPDVKGSFLQLAGRLSIALGRRGVGGRLLSEAALAVEPPDSPPASASIRQVVFTAAGQFRWNAGEGVEASRLWDKAAAAAIEADQPHEAARLFLRSGEALRLAGALPDARQRFVEARTLAEGDATLTKLARVALARVPGP